TFDAHHPDGVWLEAHAYPSEDGLSVYLHDVTARKRGELLLARLAAIVEFSGDAILGMTAAGVITSWNGAAERLYGWPAGEAVGRPVSLIVPPDRADELQRVLDRLRRGEPVGPFDTVRLRKDGSPVEVSVTAS